LFGVITDWISQIARYDCENYAQTFVFKPGCIFRFMAACGNNGRMVRAVCSFSFNNPLKRQVCIASVTDG